MQCYAAQGEHVAAYNFCRWCVTTAVSAALGLARAEALAPGKMAAYASIHVKSTEKQQYSTREK